MITPSGTTVASTSPSSPLPLVQAPALVQGDIMGGLQHAQAILGDCIHDYVTVVRIARRVLAATPPLFESPGVCVAPAAS